MAWQPRYFSPKANTANSFSLPVLALSTANLYTAIQPGGSLFDLQESNPVDTEAVYKGPSEKYGQSNDPLVGKKLVTLMFSAAVLRYMMLPEKYSVLSA